MALDNSNFGDFPLQHSKSDPISSPGPRMQDSHINPYLSLQQSRPRNNSYNNPQLSSTITGPRTLSIRFAPLPDPRASRPLLTTPSGISVWCSREELPDGTWGEYKMVIKRDNGQVVAVEDLQDIKERKAVLEAFEEQSHFNPDLLHEAPKQPISNRNYLYENDQSRKLSTANSTIQSPDVSSETRLGNLFNDSVPSQANTTGGFPLYRTTSADTVSILSSSSLGNLESQARNNYSSSLTKKLIDVVKKPLKSYSHKLTPTASLPIEQISGFGAPLTKSRSAESTLSKRSTWRSSLNLGIRRTQSREEASSTSAFKTTTPIMPSANLSEDRIVLPLEAERMRRRAKYPPVAQRKAHMGGSRGGAGKVPLVEEPEFVEWGAPSNTALVKLVKDKKVYYSAPATSKEIKEDTEEDDGSGIAWLKKRKKEREERAKREVEERAMVSSMHQDILHPISDGPNNLGENTKTDALVMSDLRELIERPEKSTIIRGQAEHSTSRNQHVQSDSLDGRSRCSSETTSSSTGSGSLNGDSTSNDSSSQAQSLDSSPSRRKLPDEEDLNEEELEEEERLKARALIESPFLRGAKEVFKDREHHRVLKT
ncbi:hypothetical protein BY996DRAFT_6424547 [Phakopsora pachyrhizi]|nr:hypothetical protein BY996DRAFT_6424547 [Phakopsora pachyrhizi]